MVSAGLSGSDSSESASLTPVLIIDDEPSVLEGLKEFLEDEGYSVHLASSGSEGLGIFSKVKPELVVTDLRMPGISGMDFIRQVKTINPDVAVIVITGYGTLATAVDAIRLNVFDFIGKPIDLEQFKATLDRARDSVAKSQKIHKELESLKEQLLLAQSHLSEYQEKVSEVESLALAGRLLAGILHNLNSPLTYIMGQTQILQMIHPEVENLEKIEEQAVRMGQIITTLLKRVKQSQVRQSEMLQLNQVLRDEALFLESHPYFRTEIRKEWRLANDLPLIQGIASDFSQVFGNIFRNAAEAMKNQPIRILTISSSYDEQEIRITIQDTGPGIPKSLQRSIFQPFFSTKVKEVGISGSVGMGLGLYSCQQMVHQYGGRIELVSRPGKGATFIIHLPKSNPLKTN
jgi:signal transduction histidine kinase